jgi:hypothetical protein
MQVGDIFHASEHYGGSHHDIGLFQVLKLGKKFASLKDKESTRKTSSTNITS